MAKVIFADAILKQKGIEKKTFDTSKFNDVVLNFFLTHEAKATILLRPERFIEKDNPPEGDFIVMLDDEDWVKRLDDPNDSFDHTDLFILRNNNLFRPTLVIDEPFITNAAHYLRSICGFSVQNRTRRGKKEYIVSLPI